VVWLVGFGAEKETEKLNNARQLLLRNDHNLVAQAALHLGYAMLCYAPFFIVTFFFYLGVMHSTKDYKFSLVHTTNF
jgi:hypothetical protein